MLLKGKQDISFLVQQITAWDFGIVKLPQHYPNMKQKLPWGHVASPIVVRRLWWQQTDRWVMIVSLCCMILEKVRTVSAKWITACPWFKIPVIFTCMLVCLQILLYFRQRDLCFLIWKIVCRVTSNKDSQHYFLIKFYISSWIVFLTIQHASKKRKQKTIDSWQQKGIHLINNIAQRIDSKI